MSTPTPNSDADRAEIRRLVEAYAIAMDRVDVAAFEKLFVADGALVVRAPEGQQLGVFSRPAGVATIATMMDELYQATLHHITTHAVDVEDDTATGVTYCLAYHVVGGEDGGALETLGVRYDERFVRTANGWRFSIRDATRLWSQTTPTPAHPLQIDRAAAQARRAETADR